MKKRILLTLLVLSCSLAFVGCKTDKKVMTLNTPTELEVENQYISFNEVENASYYNVYYDGNTFTLKPSNDGEIVFNASKIFTEAKTYEIKVKAIGTGKYADSPYTQIVRYTRLETLEAPVIRLNNQTLTWATVKNANYYTIKVVYPDETQGFYTYNTNSFDIRPILGDVGKYVFQVKAGNVNDNNDYSNEFSYTFTKQLNTPTNLSLKYNKQENEIYLYYIGDRNSYGYTIIVNGESFDLTDANLEQYADTTEYENLLEIKLLSFLKSKDTTFNTVGDFSVSVQSKKALSDNYYNSNISSKCSISLTSVLTVPQATIATNNGSSKLSWTDVENATSYAVYKNYEFYTSVANDIKSITFNTLDIENDILTVQAEGVNRKYSSLMSIPVSVSPLTESDSSNLSLNSSILSWSAVNDVNKYVLEIYNSKILKRYVFDGETTSVNLATELEFDNYNAKLTVYKNGKMPVSTNKSINYLKRLTNITNAQIGSTHSMYTLSFDAVEGALGYAVKLNNQVIDQIFTSNSIDLTNYILLTGSFSVSVKAIADPARNILSSDWVSAGNVKHAIKLTAPQLSVDLVDGAYILKFDEIANANKYSILINYVSIFESGTDYSESGYDISSYLTSAQRYTVMVKANAGEEDNYYTDSDYSVISVPKYVQLDTINDDIMLVENKEGKYWLNFTTQTHAANYDIRILKVDTETESKFNITTTPFDITRYVQASGTYRIYVRAMAQNDENYLYLSSAESGNPYVLVKDKPSLLAVSNITVADKVAGSNSLLTSWDVVPHADVYYINVFYTPASVSGAQTTLVNEVTVTTNKFNVADYLSKEGIYTIKIKAISNGDYESSAFVTYAYNYTMTVDMDFKRNLVFMNGENYSHYITSYEQLKNLLGYYYLYNNEYNYYEPTIPSFYKLKIMLGVDIDVLNQQCEDANFEFVNNGENLLAKLHEIAYQSISLYKENFYLASNQFNSPIQVSEGGVTYYLFDYYTGFENDKTATIADAQDIVKFDEKQTNIPQVLRRNSNYIFDLDMCEKTNVTTTEQLFMAVQYDKSPNFVGNCTVAKNIYNDCRAILNTICNEDMNDYEKVVAIYDWLSSNVEYNYKFETLSMTKPLLSDYTTASRTDIMGDCKYDYLEGVFLTPEDRSATSNGYSKAFVLMCKLEGIDAIKVNGVKNDRVWYWNKVYVDATPNDESNTPKWFTIDIASSYQTTTINLSSYQVPGHQFFLVTDSFIKLKLNVVERFVPKEALSVTEFNYFANTLYSYSKVITVIDSGRPIRKEFSGSGTLQYLTSFGSAESYIIDIMKYIAFESDNEHNCVVEVDMTNSSTAIETLMTNITTAYYGEVSSSVNFAFRIVTSSYDNVITISVRPNS